MDRGMWITWYDLPQDGRAAYLDWLHGRYLPALARLPGILWAAHYASVDHSARKASARESTIGRTNDPSVPTGHRYIQMVGAEHPHVFGNPSPAEYHTTLPEGDRAMLAQRIGERVNLMVEAARLAGPEAKQYPDGAGPAPCIQMGSFNIAPQDEEAVLAWYTQWRMPAMTETKGCVRFRTLASVAGWAKHAVLYEFTSLAARNEHFVTHEDTRPGMKAVSDRMVSKLTHAPGSANVATRTWPPVHEG